MLKSEDLARHIETLCPAHKAEYGSRLAAVAFDPVATEDLKKEMYWDVECPDCDVVSTRAWIAQKGNHEVALRGPIGLCPPHRETYALSIASFAPADGLWTDEMLRKLNELQNEIYRNNCSDCAALEREVMKVAWVETGIPYEGFPATIESATPGQLKLLDSLSDFLAEESQRTDRADKRGSD